MDSTDRKSVNMLLGEATLALVNRNAPVSWLALMQELKSIVETEDNTNRRNIGELIISEIFVHLLDKSSSASGSLRFSAKDAPDLFSMPASAIRH